MKRDNWFPTLLLHWLSCLHSICSKRITIRHPVVSFPLSLPPLSIIIIIIIVYSILIGCKFQYSAMGPKYKKKIVVILIDRVNDLFGFSFLSLFIYLFIFFFFCIYAVSLLLAVEVHCSTPTILLTDPTGRMWASALRDEWKMTDFSRWQRQPGDDANRCPVHSSNVFHRSPRFLFRNSSHSLPSRHYSSASNCKKK